MRCIDAVTYADFARPSQNLALIHVKNSPGDSFMTRSDTPLRSFTIEPEIMFGPKAAPLSGLGSNFPLFFPVFPVSAPSGNSSDNNGGYRGMESGNSEVAILSGLQT
jgi:hypothetical protein